VDGVGDAVLTVASLSETGAESAAADSPTSCDDRRRKSAPSGRIRPTDRTRSGGKGSDTVARDGSLHGIDVISNDI
jgi:hypothetical protein